MEKHQKKRINQQLVELLDNTICTAKFLAEFQKKGVLSRSDVVTLEVEERNKGCLQQSKKFYEIIQTRRGAYDILLEALKNTAQNGALAFLENETSQRGKKASKKISYISPPKYLPDFLTGPNTTLVIHTPDCEITCSRIVETVPNVTMYTPENFVDSIPYPPSSTSRTEQKIPLINCQQGIDYLSHSLENPKKKIVVLLEEMSDETHAICIRMQCKNIIHQNDDLEWNDLHPSMKISVEKTQKSFQFPVNCGDGLSKLKGRVLFELIKGHEPTLFKNTIPPKISYYIPRRLITRNIISKEVFQSSGRELFLLKGMERHELTEIAHGQVTDTSSNLIARRAWNSIKFALLDSDLDYDTIIAQVGDERPVHVIEYNDEKFYWIKSSAAIYSIQGAVDSSQDTLTEDEFLEKVVNLQSNKNDPICISDSPGMGKSVLLAAIGQKLQQKALNFWNVGFVVISELVESTKQFASKPYLNDKVMSFLASTLCETELGAVYFQNDRKQLTNLLLDGLDEVHAEDIEYAYQLLKLLRDVLPNTKIWVTTRPHMFSSLEKTFNVLGYNILGFEEKDQISFLKLYWSRESATTNTELHNLDTFARNCLSTIKSQINLNKDQDIAGIPLQCLLIGEVFEEDAFRFGTTTTTTLTMPILGINSVSDLYERLVKKKFDKFYERYDKDNYGYVDLTKEHTYYSLWLLFPTFRDKFAKEYRSNPLSVQAVFNVGILESKSVIPCPRFIHRTFAEYFVANFVVGALSSHFIFNLLYKNILKTRKVHQQKFAKAKFSCRQFVHNVVCYFLDSLISKAGAVQCKDELNTECADLDLIFWRQLCEACAYSSFKNIFNHLMCDLPSFKVFEKKIFTERFVVLCTVFSDVTIASAAYEKFKRLSGQNLAKIKSQGYSLVQFTVIRGDYKLFEKNTALLEQNALQDGEFCWGLVRDCVTQSESNSCHIIKEKMEIICSLLRAVRSSKYSLKFDSYEHFLSSGLNIDLASKLVECSQVTEKGTIEFVHDATRLYNCTDYQKLLKVIATKNEDWISRIVNSERNGIYLIENIIKHMVLSPEFLEYLKQLGLDFNLLGCWISRIAKNKGECIHLLEIIIKNMVVNSEFLEHLKQLGLDFNLLDTEELFRMICMERSKTISTCNLKTFLASLNKLQIDNDGNTIVHKICMETSNISARLEVIKHLLCNGADAKAKNLSSETPLDILVRQNRTIDGLLLMNLLQSSYSNKEEILFLKINWIVKGIEEMQFKDYADICSKVTTTNPRDKYGNTLLHLLTKRKYYPAIEHLLSLGVDVNAQNMRKETPLHFALEDGEITLKSWKVWLDYGADLCSCDVDNRTPIHELGVDHTNLHLIEYAMNHALVAHSPKLQDIFLLTLSLVDMQLTKKLCEWFTKNAATSLNDVQGSFKGKQATVLDVALHNDNVNVIRYVVETEKCVKALQPFGYTWFYKSLSTDGVYERIKYLELTNKLFPDLINTPDENGLNPLSTKNINPDVAITLIKLGANVNAVDKFGNTPLHWALKHNDFHSAELLEIFIKFGADVNAVTNDQETPLLLSLKTNYSHSFSYTRSFIKLVECGSDLRKDFFVDNTILHQAMRFIFTQYLPDVIDLLLKKGYQDLLQFADVNNQTPIQIAQQRCICNEELLQVLNSHGIQA